MAEKIFSPCNIEVLLHCHTRPEPHPNWDAIAVQEALERFLLLDCIVPDDVRAGCYRTTPRGQAWVDALCAVECPRLAYVDQHMKVLRVVPGDPVSSFGTVNSE